MNDLTALHKAADYYEPLFRARFVRAMRALKKRISVQDIARAIQLRQTSVVHRKEIEQVLQPCGNIMRDAVRRGGIIGAERVNKL